MVPISTCSLAPSTPNPLSFSTPLSPFPPLPHPSLLESPPPSPSLLLYPLSLFPPPLLHSSTPSQLHKLLDFKELREFASLLKQYRDHLPISEFLQRLMDIYGAQRSFLIPGQRHHHTLTIMCSLSHSHAHAHTTHTHTHTHAHALLGIQTISNFKLYSNTHITGKQTTNSQYIHNKQLHCIILYIVSSLRRKKKTEKLLIPQHPHPHTTPLPIYTPHTSPLTPPPVSLSLQTCVLSFRKKTELSSKPSSSKTISPSTNQLLPLQQSHAHHHLPNP